MASKTALLCILITLIARCSTQTTVLNNIIEHQAPVNVTLGQTIINGVVTPIAMTIDSIRVSNGGSTLFNVSSNMKFILGDSVLPTRVDTVIGTPPAGSLPVSPGSLVPLWIYITVANTTVPVHLDINPATFLQAVATNFFQSPPTLFGVGANSGGLPNLASLIPPFLQQPSQTPPLPPLHAQIGRNSLTGFPLLTNFVSTRPNPPSPPAQN